MLAHISGQLLGPAGVNQRTVFVKLDFKIGKSGDVRHGKLLGSF
ncbi:MAG: hypothetical protein ABIR56_05790 [Polaromonas sp.]